MLPESEIIGNNKFRKISSFIMDIKLGIDFDVSHRKGFYDFLSPRLRSFSFNCFIILSATVSVFEISINSFPL